MTTRPNRKIGQRVFYITSSDYAIEGRISAITDVDLSIVWQPFSFTRTYTYDPPAFWEHIVFCCDTL
jgi:hypothetical protein